MQIPLPLLQSLEGVAGFDRAAFEAIHASAERVTSIRLNPLKADAGLLSKISSTGISPVPWAANAYYISERPSFTFDPLFHAGCYYVQEASSMFLEQALKQTTDLSKPLRVLDLCAAPGGKSTHIQSLINNQSLLVSNELIRSRANVLKDNMIKWGSANVLVTHNDPADFARLEGFFDIMVVDAPCSGSGLFRKEPEAIDEWSFNNVALCSQRQQRILADAWPCLKKDGLLIYSTCSYSPAEDEELLDWLMQTMQVENVRLQMSSEWNIVEAETKGGAFGYRLWPHLLKGEGLFLACLRKKDGEDSFHTRLKRRPDRIDKKDESKLEKWIRKEGLQYVRHEQTVYAWPDQHMADFSIVLEQMRLIYSGVLMGEFYHDKLVPAHALAMSALTCDDIPRIPLDLEDSIRYLQRKDLLTHPGNTGWQLVTYESKALGWVNALKNRMNNYYPKELRILKDK